MKDSKEIAGPGSKRHALEWAAECIGRVLARGGTCTLTLEDDDGPNKDMRGKLHAMISDIANQCKFFNGFDMGKKKVIRFESWKAVVVSVVAGDRMVPGYNGGWISIRPSTERASKRFYCDCIEAAYMIGAERKVVWSEPEKYHSDRIGAVKSHAVKVSEEVP